MNIIKKCEILHNKRAAGSVFFRIVCEILHIYRIKCKGDDYYE